MEVAHQDLDANQSTNKRNWNPWLAFAFTSTYGGWNIGNLLKLVKMAYSPCKTLGCGIILNTMHGTHDIFRGKGNNVGGDHAKSQST